MEIDDLHTILAGAGKNLDAYLVKSLLIVSPNLVYVYDLTEKRYVFISGEAPFILGSSADEILAMKEAVNTRLVHPEDLPNLDDHYRQCAEASDGDLIEVEYRIKHVYGDWHWLSVRDTPLVLVKREKPRYVLGVAEDISERRAAQEKVWYVSTHDQLTGIFNRAYFEAEIERMEKSRRYPISILYVDVDALRSVNNQHGQPAGDELLRGTAQVLLGAFPRGRRGGAPGRRRICCHSAEYRHCFNRCHPGQGQDALEQSQPVPSQYPFEPGTGDRNSGVRPIPAGSLQGCGEENVRRQGIAGKVIRPLDRLLRLQSY